MILTAWLFAAAVAAPVLEGVVVDPANKPVAGARLLVNAVPARGDLPLKAVTAKDGRYHIALRRGGRHTVRVLTGDFGPVYLSDVDVTKPLRIPLKASAVIEGFVRDATTRQPIPGLTVTARGRHEAGVSGYELLDVSSRTDGAGRFVLRGLAPATHTLSAFGRGYRRQVRDNVPASLTPARPVELYVMPGGGAAGTVRDARGRPVEGALVFFGRERGFREPPVARTAPDGRFEAGVEPGSYVVMALKEGQGPGVAREVEVDDHGAEIDLRLTAPARVALRLVDEDGRPREGEIALVSVEEAEVPPEVARLLQTVAGADGRAELRPLPAGMSLRLSATARGFAKRFVEVSVPPAPAEGVAVDAGDVVLSVGRSVRGRIHDAQGRGVADARVSAQSGMTWADSQSNADGSFTVAGLAAGSQRVSIHAEGYHDWEGEALADGEPLDVTLGPEGVIVGRVVDTQGHPVAQFTASASDGEQTAAGAWSEESGQDGAFRLRNLKAGTYGIRVEARDFAPSTVTGVKVKAGETVDAGTVRLQPGLRLTGTVVDTAGAAVAGAEVETYPAERTMFNDRTVVTTEGDGSFTFGGLVAGRYDVSARHPSYARARLEGLTIPESGAVPAAKLTLSAGGVVNGVVNSRTPFEGLVLAGRGMLGSEQAGIGPDGTFVLPRVPAGETEVTLMRRVAGGRMQSVRSTTLTVPEGGEASVEFTLREVHVRGRLTGPDGPVPAARLTFARGESRSMTMYFSSAASGGPVAERNTAETREDGSFETVLDDAGPDFTVRVQGIDRPFAQTLTNVAVPDVEEHEMELVLPGARVSGLMVDGATGRPIATGSVQVVREPREAAAAPVTATTGPDGTFRAYVDEGRHRVLASAQGYGSVSEVVDVPSTGAEVRLTLEPGASLRGRVVDARNGVVGQGMVWTTPASGDRMPRARWLEPDGRFLLEGLQPGLYNVLAGTESSGWGFAAGVRAPGEVSLTARPGGLLAMTVTCDGKAARDVSVSLERVGAAPLYGRPQFERTGQEVTMSVPAGPVELRVGSTGCVEKLLPVEAAAGRRIERVVELTARP